MWQKIVNNKKSKPSGVFVFPGSLAPLLEIKLCSLYAALHTEAVGAARKKKCAADITSLTCGGQFK